VRARFEQVADALFVLVTMAAGIVAVIAPLRAQGFVLGGSACGGGGDEQRCTGIARQLSLVEVSPHAWAYVAGGALCILLAAAAFALRRQLVARIVLGVSVLCIAFVGLVHTAHVDGKLGPTGGGTVGRELEDWGAFLSPALSDLRRDALRRYAGTRTEPGGPLYDREQILDSFSVRERDGWRYLYAAVVIAFFAAGLETVRRLVRRPTVAIVTTASVGVVLWAMVLDRVRSCDPGASECYDGLGTILAVAAALVGWTAYLSGVFVGLLVDRVSTRRRRGATGR
jgi:hypothetical protein